MDLMSPNLIQEATAAKLYDPDHGEFNFAKAFAEDYIDPALCLRGRYSCGRKLLKEYSKNGKKIDVGLLKYIYRCWQTTKILRIETEVKQAF